MTVNTQSAHTDYIVPEKSKDRSFQMRVDDEWLERVDDWRRQQKDLPPRAEAIRRLVAKALEMGEDH